MKIDNRKDCKRMTAQECYLLRNKAIPESTMATDEDALLGRQVMYEPYLIHSPVLTSTRLQKKTTKVRLSKKYMHKLNDVIDSLVVDELANSIDALVISNDDDKNKANHEPIATSTSLLETEPEEASLVAVVTSSSDVGIEIPVSSDVDEEPPAEMLGRVQLKIIDQATNKEIVVSRCVRFIDTEEVEI